ncbi:universal stress protein [Streptosporangiaceae bacterium NEAU-GS5]|nr:universal stress protein [Streptosporangiaceae bacterium NEAU-GS5]
MPESKIVVGFSGSPGSFAALRWAAAEGRLRGAAVEAVHAWEWSGDLRAPYAPRRAGSREDEWCAALDNAERAVRLMGDDNVSAIAVEGPPVQVLLRYSGGAGLLVLGSREQGDVVHPAVGPVIAACLLRAFCPVVVVADGVGAISRRPLAVI